MGRLFAQQVLVARQAGSILTLFDFFNLLNLVIFNSFSLITDRISQFCNEIYQKDCISL